MKNLTKEQIEFFQQMQYIKEEYIVLLMMNIKKSIKLDEKDYSVLEEVIDDQYVDSMAQIMELIDGYGGLSYELDLINRENKNSIREGIQLHDVIMDYIYYNKNDRS